MGTRQKWTWAVRGLLVAVVGVMVWQGLAAAGWRKVTATEEARQVVLEQTRAIVDNRAAVSAQLQADLIAGRVPLRTTADRFLVLFSDLNGAAVMLEQRCPGRSQSEQAALHLIWRTSNDPDVDPAVVGRLKREFVEEYLLNAPDRVTRTKPVGQAFQPDGSPTGRRRVANTAWADESGWKA